MVVKMKTSEVRKIFSMLSSWHIAISWCQLFFEQVIPQRSIISLESNAKYNNKTFFISYIGKVFKSMLLSAKGTQWRAYRGPSEGTAWYNCMGRQWNYMSGASEMSVTSFHKCTSENFLWEIILMQKGGIVALFMAVKIFKLYNGNF